MALFLDIAKILGKLPQRDGALGSSSSSSSFAAPSFNANATSLFDLIRPPQPAQFDVTAASGTKPKNYQPTQVSMSGVPAAAVFAMPGASPLPQQVFTVTPASGTKPKNYQPTQISMNAPQLAGPQAMQQMLALMGGFQPSPFAPYGQG